MIDGAHRALPKSSTASSHVSTHGFLDAVPPRTQIHVRFPRFGTRLNTRRCDLPLQGEISGLRGQAALRARCWAGNPPQAHCPGHLRWRRCRPPRGRLRLPLPGEAAVTARHIAPSFPRRPSRRPGGSPRQHRAAPCRWPARCGPSRRTYWPAQLAAKHLPTDMLSRQQYWHALPDGWEEMDYPAFLRPAQRAPQAAALPQAPPPPELPRRASLGYHCSFGPRESRPLRRGRRVRRAASAA
jgi:hypothetical protein